MIELTLLFILINLFLAKKDSKKIAAGMEINHTNNAVFYGLLCVIAIPLIGLIETQFGTSFFTWVGIGQIVVSLMLTRKIVFDIGLNLFRKLDWNYISTTTTSKIDQFENKIFKNNGTFKYGLYSLLLITNIILYFKFIR